LKVGDGDGVNLGIDPFVGGEKNYMFPIPLIGFLNEKGYISLAHINKPFSLSMGIDYRLNGENLGLQEDWARLWNQYVMGLNLAGIRLTTELDSIIWSRHVTGVVSAKTIYEVVMLSSFVGKIHWWYHKL